MPSNSATAKIERAKRHLLMAQVLLQSLPSRYWEEPQTSEEISQLAADLTQTQQKIKAIRDPDRKNGK